MRHKILGDFVIKLDHPDQDRRADLVIVIKKKKKKKKKNLSASGHSCSSRLFRN